MLVLFRHLFGWLTRVFRSQADLILENQALRRQLLALHAHRPRPRLGSLDRMFWVTLRRLWMLDEGMCKSMIVREQANADTLCPFVALIGTQSVTVAWKAVPLGTE